MTTAAGLSVARLRCPSRRLFSRHRRHHHHLSFSSSSSSSSAAAAGTPRQVLVVGSGAIGLRTAWEILQRSNNTVKVIVQSPRPPLDPAVCSMGAGGLWMPFHVEDAYNRVDQWAVDTFNELYPLAIDPNSDLVEIVPAVSLFREHQGYNPLQEFDNSEIPPEATKRPQKAPPPWTQDPRLEFQHLTVEMLTWQNYVMKLKIPSQEELVNAGYLHAWLFKPPIVDTVKMLQYFMDQISSHPNTLDINVPNQSHCNQEYTSMDEMCQHAIELGCDAVVNCTGLGAAQICNDDQMIGARGVLHQYDRSNCPRRPEIMECSQYGTKPDRDAVITCEESPWGSETEPCYMIPRGDVIVVGGSYLEGDTEPSIRDHERERLLLNAQRMGIDIEQSTPIGEWTGFRPFRRSGVRCEIDPEFSAKYQKDNLHKVIHSYGYGGSGWTLNVGAAKAVANMLFEKNSK